MGLLLGGDFPKEIHINCKRHSIEEVPVPEEDSSRWLVNIWAEKEKNLKEFYVKKKFPGPERRCAKNTNPKTIKPMMVGSYVFWSMVPIVFGYLCYEFPNVRYAFFAGHLFFLYFTHLRRGFDTMEIDMLHTAVKTGQHHRFSHPEVHMKKKSQ